jgi:hypothetical protein
MASFVVKAAPRPPIGTDFARGSTGKPPRLSSNTQLRRPRMITTITSPLNFSIGERTGHSGSDTQRVTGGQAHDFVRPQVSDEFKFN